MAFRYCNHIKTDGIQCHSPAVRDRKYCHYHGLYRQRSHFSKGTPGALKEPFVDANGTWLELEVREPAAKRYSLGALEDGPSLQVAISTIVNALADNRLDIGRASTLLYGLQLASTNLRNFHVEAPAADANAGAVDDTSEAASQHAPLVLPADALPALPGTSNCPQLLPPQELTRKFLCKKNLAPNRRRNSCRMKNLAQPIRGRGCTQKSPQGTEG